MSASEALTETQGGVVRLVEAAAEARPSAPAISAPDGTLTYQELVSRADEVARRLLALGIGPEDLVGLCLPRSAALIVGALGILKAGGAYVALDPTYPETRLRHIIADSGSDVLLTDLHAAHTFDRDAMIVALGDGGEVDPQRSTAVTAGVGRLRPADAITGTDLAYVVYTSGSSGAPKGVMIEHAALLNLVRWHQAAFALGPDDRASQVASPGFDAAVWEIWPYLACGAAVDVPPEDVRLDPMAMRDWLTARRISISFLPTPMAEQVLALPWDPGCDLRYLLTGGDALHRAPPTHLPFALVNNYGLSETTVVSTSGIIEPTNDPALVPSIGKPIHNVDLHIVDAELRPVPAGETGELVVGGVSVARGYVNLPALSAERFPPDPFAQEGDARCCRTGDLVRQRPNGEIEFLGRIDQQVKIRGYRIELEEIAAAMDLHPAVSSSVVVAVGDGAPGRRLVAYVVPANASIVDEAVLRDHLGRRLPEYMVPSSFEPIAAIPLTPHGKIDRDALPALTVARQREVSRAPNGAVELTVAQIVASLLDVDAVGADDNFFLLGGHSLLGAQLISRLEDEFAIELSLRQLFDNPTVADLGLQVEEALMADIDAQAAQPSSAGTGSPG